MCGWVSAAMSAKCGRVNEIKVENSKNKTQKKRLRRIQNNQLKSHGPGSGGAVLARTESVIGINKL